ncbi:hypothetical protein FBY40_1311 [Microbacterium sp. SLBN-154]|uniref:putative immunity protein n=1 Tax=Microbacterium sp. SLBN-154 TaxID=2768458 RepID=UPI00114F53DC|nr:hypothetical protein [Microbacterium sp. SLBN-154]TQK18822.1 hypothetical protein FBY40_1311 [Microbacterium sp. SLBN-154]
MGSPQTLSGTDRRLVAAWAADCAERVLPLFERVAPDDPRPRDAIARTRAFARGELETAGEIRRRFVAGRAAAGLSDAAAVAAARAAAQAAAVAHMGAHSLGAAAYAARAARLAAPGDPDAAAREIRRQIGALTDESQAALMRLPLLGENTAGPLGAGLLARGDVAAHIRLIQASLVTI